MVSIHICAIWKFSLAQIYLCMENNVWTTKTPGISGSKETRAKQRRARTPQQIYTWLYRKRCCAHFIVSLFVVVVFFCFFFYFLLLCHFRHQTDFILRLKYELSAFWVLNPYVTSHGRGCCLRNESQNIVNRIDSNVGRTIKVRSLELELFVRNKIDTLSLFRFDSLVVY